MQSKTSINERRFQRLVDVARRFVIALAVVGLLGAVTWFNRLSLAHTAVDLWTVSDPIQPADAVAVLGGGAETRPVAAAEYYRAGLVQKVLLSNVRAPALAIDMLPSETELNRLKLGVPDTAIKVFGSASSSTYQEAAALRDWVLRSHAHAVIVPTEYFSARRVRWIVARELIDTGAKVEVAALNDPEYPRAEWWK